jgi:hypothetical protein
MAAPVLPDSPFFTQRAVHSRKRGAEASNWLEENFLEPVYDISNSDDEDDEPLPVLALRLQQVGDGVLEIDE